MIAVTSQKSERKEREKGAREEVEKQRRWCEIRCQTRYSQRWCVGNVVCICKDTYSYCTAYDNERESTDNARAINSWMN